MSSKSFLVIAAVAGFLAVALGALGAHGMEKRWDALPDRADAVKRAAHWQTAAHYHLLHAVALAAVSVSAAPRRFKTSVILWCAGIVLFSGSLYLMAFYGVDAMRAAPDVLRKVWVISTPVGGVLFMVGWGALAFPRRAD